MAIFATFAGFFHLLIFASEFSKKYSILEIQIQELEQTQPAREDRTKSHWPNRKYQMCHFILCVMFIYYYVLSAVCFLHSHQRVNRINELARECNKNVLLNGKTCMFLAIVCIQNFK